MYCQKCYKKLPDTVNVCPSCHYNNSPFLTQPNILFGTNKDREPEMVIIDINGTVEDNNAKGIFKKFTKAVSSVFKGDTE